MYKIVNLINGAMKLNPSSSANIQGNKFKLEREVSEQPEIAFKETITFLY